MSSHAADFDQHLWPNVYELDFEAVERGDDVIPLNITHEHYHAHITYGSEWDVLGCGTEHPLSPNDSGRYICVAWRGHDGPHVTSWEEYAEKHQFVITGLVRMDKTHGMEDLSG